MFQNPFTLVEDIKNPDFIFNKFSNIFACMDIDVYFPE